MEEEKQKRDRQRMRENEDKRGNTKDKREISDKEKSYSNHSCNN